MKRNNKKKVTYWRVFNERRDNKIFRRTKD